MPLTSKSNPTDIALVEMHDARVEELRIPMNGSCVLRFEHLTVYRERAAERFAIWSYRASLELREVERVVVNEARIDHDYVSDGSALRGSEELPWQTLLHRQQVSRVEFTFGSGRQIEIDCKEAHLILDEAVRVIEEWTGPLL